MIKIKCNKGLVNCELKNTDFFEICCIIATLIQKIKKTGLDEKIIKMGVESALEIVEKEESKNE